MNTEYYHVILYLVQIVSIYNAITMGWNVRKIGMNRYELSTKSKEATKIGLAEIIENIFAFNALV